MADRTGIRGVAVLTALRVFLAILLGLAGLIPAGFAGIVGGVGFQCHREETRRRNRNHARIVGGVLLLLFICLAGNLAGQDAEAIRVGIQRAPGPVEIWTEGPMAGGNNSVTMNASFDLRVWSEIPLTISGWGQSYQVQAHTLTHLRVKAGDYNTTVQFYDRNGTSLYAIDLGVVEQAKTAADQIQPVVTVEDGFGSLTTGILIGASLITVFLAISFVVNRMSKVTTVLSPTTAIGGIVFTIVFIGNSIHYSLSDAGTWVAYGTWAAVLLLDVCGMVGILVGAWLNGMTIDKHVYLEISPTAKLLTFYEGVKYETEEPGLARFKWALQSFQAIINRMFRGKHTLLKNPLGTPPLIKMDYTIRWGPKKATCQIINKYDYDEPADTVKIDDVETVASPVYDWTEMYEKNENGKFVKTSRKVLAEKVSPNLTNLHHIRNCKAILTSDHQVQAHCQEMIEMREYIIYLTQIILRLSRLIELEKAREWLYNLMGLNKDVLSLRVGDKTKDEIKAELDQTRKELNKFKIEDDDEETPEDGFELGNTVGKEEQEQEKKKGKKKGA